MSWIALTRLSTNHRFYKRLVKGNVILHVSLQSDHSRNFLFNRGYTDISQNTGLSLSAVKRQVEQLCKEGVITRHTRRQGDRFQTELYLNPEHELFENLVQTEPQTAPQPEPHSEPQEASIFNGSLDSGEPESEPQPEPETEPNSTIIQELHNYSIEKGIDTNLISIAIDLARYWAVQWNERTGKKKRLGKANAKKFLIQLAENRDPDQLRRLCEFLPEEYKRWRDGDDQFAFRSEDISAFRDSDRYLTRIRKMESMPSNVIPMKRRGEVPEIVKKIESDPFYEPTQEELVEYQEHTSTRS